VRCFFFFSSRRRHTRFSRDWSSDVCSSDLGAASGGSGASGIGMWLENPLVGGRRALTLGRGASLRAARFAGAFLPARLPGATRLREAALPEDALAGAALAGVLAVVFDLPGARDAVLPARPPGREVPVCAFFA